MATERYNHVPLSSPDSFRVLDLHPSLDHDATICCTIREAQMIAGEIPRYEAVSYVWRALPGIRCDGKDLEVTANCLEAMKYLRLTWRRRTLWIDAICIDQRENDWSRQERSKQIAMMGGLYSSATRVIAWLGPSVPGLKEVTKLWRAIAKLSNMKRRMPVRAKLFCKMFISRYLARFPNGLERLRKAARYIAQNPWWFRAWTLQEQVMARKCIILCGRVQLPLSGDSFWEAFMSLVGIGILSWSSIEQFQVRIQLTRFLGRCSPFKMLGYQVMSIPFQLESSEPVDKIYAMYGVLETLGFNLPQPDHTKTLGQVYEETTIEFIKAEESIAMLFYATRPPDSSHLPSWVPDWNSTNYDINILRRMDLGHRPISGENYGHLGPCPVEKTIRLSFQPGRLRTHGKCLGTLQYSRRAAVDAHTKDGLPTPLVFKETCHDWCRSVKSRVASYPTDDSVPLAFLKTLTYDAVDIDYSDQNTLLGAFAWMDMMSYPRTRNEKVDTLYKNVSQDATQFMRYAAKKSSITRESLAIIIEDFEEDYIRDSLRRFSFSILDSGYMAVGISYSRPGDEVYLIPGSLWPLILRPEGDSYRYVGFAYVHGVMQGEGWEKAEPLREITII